MQNITILIVGWHQTNWRDVEFNTNCSYKKGLYPTGSVFYSLKPFFHTGTINPVPYQICIFLPPSLWPSAPSPLPDQSLQTPTLTKLWKISVTCNDLSLFSAINSKKMMLAKMDLRVLEHTGTAMVFMTRSVSELLSGLKSRCDDVLTLKYHRFSI